MKPAENAPSAKNRRSMFGMRCATRNASITSDAPKYRAKTTSLTSPKILEISVMPLTTEVLSANFSPEVRFSVVMEAPSLA